MLRFLKKPFWESRQSTTIYLYIPCLLQNTHKKSKVRLLFKASLFLFRQITFISCSITGSFTIMSRHPDPQLRCQAHRSIALSPEHLSEEWQHTTHLTVLKYRKCYIPLLAIQLFQHYARILRHILPYPSDLLVLILFLQQHHNCYGKTTCYVYLHCRLFTITCTSLQLVFRGLIQAFVVLSVGEQKSLLYPPEGSFLSFKIFFDSKVLILERASLQVVSCHYYIQSLEIYHTICLIFSTDSLFFDLLQHPLQLISLC